MKKENEKITNQEQETRENKNNEEVVEMKKCEGIYQVETKKIEEVLPEVYEALVEKFEELYERELERYTEYGDDTNEITIMKDIEEWENKGKVKIYVEGKYVEYLPEWPSKQDASNDVPWEHDDIEDVIEELETLKEYREEF
jgi:hypothetical protein